MAKHALNTYVEAEQKARLERIARLRKVSQATIVREAIEEYVNKHEPDATARSTVELWGRVLSGAYAGDGTSNDHDDVYGDADIPTRRPRSRPKSRSRRGDVNR